MKTTLAAVALLLTASALQGQYSLTTSSDPLLSKARIALRLNTGEVLILGGGIQVPDYGRLSKFPTTPGFAELLLERIQLVPTGGLAGFTVVPPVEWKAGDRWKVYPGAGQPLTVLIQKLVVSGDLVGASARFERAEDTNRILGLRADEYLAVPDPGWAGVSTDPLLPSTRQEYKLNLQLGKLLTAHARGLVASDHLLRTAPESDLDARIKFVSWRVPGRKPLLFVQAV